MELVEQYSCSEYIYHSCTEESIIMRLLLLLPQAFMKKTDDSVSKLGSHQTIYCAIKQPSKSLTQQSGGFFYYKCELHKVKGKKWNNIFRLVKKRFLKYLPRKKVKLSASRLQTACTDNKNVFFQFLFVQQKKCSVRTEKWLRW